MQLILGSAGVSPVVFDAPPKTFAGRTNAPFGAVCQALRPVGETPTGATGTVALPISTASLALETGEGQRLNDLASNLAAAFPGHLAATGQLGQVNLPASRKPCMIHAWLQRLQLSASAQKLTVF